MSAPNEVTEHYERVTNILDDYIQRSERFLQALDSIANTFMQFNFPPLGQIPDIGQAPNITSPAPPQLIPPIPPTPQTIPLPVIPTIPPPPDLDYTPADIDINAMQSIIQSLQTALETAKQRIAEDKERFQNITTDILDNIAMVLQGFQDILDSYSMFITDSQQYIETTYKELKQQVDEVNQLVKEKIDSNSYNKVIENIQKSVDALKEFSENFTNWFSEDDFPIAERIEEDLGKEAQVDTNIVDNLIQEIRETEVNCHDILKNIQDIEISWDTPEPPVITLPATSDTDLPEPPDLNKLTPIEIDMPIDPEEFDFDIPDMKDFGEILSDIENEVSRIKDTLEPKYEDFANHLKDELDKIRNEKLQKWDEYYQFTEERFKNIREEGLRGSTIDKQMAGWLPDYLISYGALESEINAIFQRYSALGYRMSPDRQYAVLTEVIRKYLEEMRIKVIEFIEKRMANYKESLAYSEKAFVDATLNSIEIYKVLLDYEEKILTLYVKFQEIIFSIRDKLYQQAISYLTLLQEHTKLQIARIQAKLDVLKSKLQMIELKVTNERLKIDYNNSLLLLYRGQVEAILNRLKYYETQITTERAKVELYEANIKAIALRNEIELAKLKVPELKIGLYNTVTRMEATHLDAVKTKIDALLQEVNFNQDRIAKKIQFFNSKISEWQAKQELKYRHRALNLEAINSITKAAISQLEGYNSYINILINYASNIREIFQTGINVALTVVDSKLKALAGQSETYRVALSGLTSALSSITSTIEPYLNAELAEVKSLIEALRAQISVVSAIAEDNKNRILYIQAEYDKYRTHIVGIHAQIEGELAKMRAPLEYNKAILETYTGELQGFQSKVNIELTKYKTLSEVAFQNAQNQMELKRLTTQISIENLRFELERVRVMFDMWKSQKEIILGGARAGAEVGASILSSALASMNSIVNLSQNLIGAIAS